MPVKSLASLCGKGFGGDAAAGSSSGPPCTLKGRFGVAEDENRGIVTIFDRLQRFTRHVRCSPATVRPKWSFGAWSKVMNRFSLRYGFD
jgi:hypothetical protein